jgi:selenocysteine-specific elongation factor
MLDDDTIEPGRRARAQLVFENPVNAVPGEHFVIRNAQALRTIAGGRVLDPFGPARKRRSPARKAWLDALSQFLDTADPNVLIDHCPLGVRRSLLIRLSQLITGHLNIKAHIVEVALRGDDAILITRVALDELGTRVIAALSDFHVRFPDEIGPQNARLKRIVEPDLDDALWHTLIRSLMVSALVVRQGPWLRLPQHTVELLPQEQALANALLASLHSAVFDPPWVRELAREQNTAEGDVREILGKLTLRGQAYQIVQDLFCHPQRLAELAQLITSIASEQVRADGSVGQCVGAAAFRDASGLGRKRAIQFLEFFDRVGYTRRHRDVHIVRTDNPWQIDGT